MHVQVDHSWQIEKTNKRTALAFTNTVQRAVFISAVTKEQALRQVTARYEQLRRPYLRLLRSVPLPPTQTPSRDCGVHHHRC
jgi:hypothetical protein